VSAEAFAVGALIELADGTDPAAVGAAVTAALCGHWEHDGPCRWPHNNAIDPSRSPARFRTLYVASPDEAALVAKQICDALRAGTDWKVVAVESRLVDELDEPLVERLLRGPRASA
jgi:hypothetical protein